MHQGTLIRALQYMRIKLVSHGFRGTASTLLNEMNYNPDWIEAQLAHSKQDAVRASYNHAQWLSQRREMMQQWADYIDGLRAGSNVVLSTRAPRKLTLLECRYLVATVATSQSP